MSRSFPGQGNSPSTGYFTYPVSPIGDSGAGDWEATFAIWVYRRGTGTAVLFGQGDLGSNSRLSFIFTSNPIFQTFDGTASRSSQIGVSSTQNQWQLWMGRSRSDGDAQLSIDKTNAAETVGFQLASNLDQHDEVSIGAQPASGHNFDIDANMAHAAIWDERLTDDERNALADGMNPMMVRPHALRFYDPLEALGNGDARDIISGAVGTEAGTTGVSSASDNPRVTMPSQSLSPFLGTDGGGGPPAPSGTIRQLMLRDVVRSLLIPVPCIPDQDKQ